jgi:Uma2 family endonuclease
MTPSVTPDPELVRMYEEAAQRYLRSLPLEHFMEATDHATQRKITLESFDVIREQRPDIQCFNELLVQYPRPKRKNIGQVVPDNMVVVHPAAIVAGGSFDVAAQPARPFLVLEYVSKHNWRKDYEDNYDKYEEELKVPYYLRFYPDNEELTVFRRAGDRYAAVTPNANGRLAIPELELDAALLDGWVRYWFRGELVPLTRDLVRRLSAEQQARLAAEQAHSAAEQRADAERQARLTAEAELARLREELAKARGGGTP